jgi:hypothetical protein
MFDLAFILERFQNEEYICLNITEKNDNKRDTKELRDGSISCHLFHRRLKRQFTALIFTVFHRDPSLQITTHVYASFLLRNDHAFTPYFYTFLE